MIPSERLKALHELAQATRRYERELADLALADLRQSNGRITARLIQLRIRELRDATMTPAERAEYQELEREAELDQQDQRNGDWTR